MDGLKLEKWKENFQRETQRLQIEFNSFFKSKKLSQCYELKVDDLNETLCLEITDEALSHEIKERLKKLLLATKPEDSI